MIKDDPDFGTQDDYVGPGVFVSLAIMVMAVIAVVQLARMVFA